MVEARIIEDGEKMTEILLPQLGETVSEGTITRWLKQPGEQVAQDEPLYEVSTDKVDTEVPAPVAGVVSEILVAEGETVEVGTLLAQLEAADGAAGAAVSEERGRDGQEGDEDGTSGEDGREGTAGDNGAADREWTASRDGSAGNERASAGAPIAVSSATESPRSSESPSAKARTSDELADTASFQSPKSDASHTDSQRMSPVVRRLLHKNGIDPASIAGTGPKGRITRRDAEAAVRKARSASEPAVKKAATVSSTGRASPATIVPVATDGMPQTSERSSSPSQSSRHSPTSSSLPTSSIETIPLSRIRKVTAEHMVRSKATSPHVLTAVEVDFEEVEKARRAHRDEWKAEEGFSLTYLPFIARAVCDALDDYPHINATVTDEELIVHHSVNLAVAVDLDFQGLIAPVVHGAENLRLRAIARQVVDLAKRARGKQLRPEEVAGGTFTITNPGQWGTLMQFPIINQPQVAILSTDGIKRKPVVVSDGYGGESIAIHSVGVLALAWDHRAFDGAYVAAFLDALRGIIETRDWEAELA